MANADGKRRWLRWLGGLGALGLALALGLWAAFQLSPWPAVWLVRQAFDAGARDASAALEKHVPGGLREWQDLAYDPSDPDGRLDVYAPAGTDEPLATVVWIHGGGFISGNKRDVANYARVLAGQGFTVVSVQYTIAPEARYPTPLVQANRAIGFLARGGHGLPVDPSRLVLAGDSAGAQLAAQLAAAYANPAYAEAIGFTPALPPDGLAGALLYCGPYDAALVGSEGAFAGFMRTVFWSYFGQREPREQVLAQFSVPRHVSPAFPPAFISAGNADPLAAHSIVLADALEAQGVPVTRLFFPDDYEPALGHESQFNLDGEAGQRALRESVAFLRGLPPRGQR
ncbi:alpha/beta hydrolase [Arenimonas sp.]|uniref:alpha/beta hydrolase n=1 Tax=Arenimonas sp. TaxID=1872635 RepID=UPI0025F31796|nr:alpha/beta hydrolase [Arenimonas sp.]